MVPFLIPRRPEAVTVASLMLVFVGTLDLLAATMLGLVGVAAPGVDAWWMIGGAAVLFAVGSGAFVGAAAVWHLMPQSREFAVAVALASFLNAPLAWPFAGAAVHLLARREVRRVLGPQGARRPTPAARQPY